MSAKGREEGGGRGGGVLLSTQKSPKIVFISLISYENILFHVSKLQPSHMAHDPFGPGGRLRAPTFIVGDVETNMWV